MKNDERVIKTGSGQTDVSGIRNGGEGGFFLNFSYVCPEPVLDLAK